MFTFSSRNRLTPKTMPMIAAALFVAGFQVSLQMGCVKSGNGPALQQDSQPRSERAETDSDALSRPSILDHVQDMIEDPSLAQKNLAGGPLTPAEQKALHEIVLSIQSLAEEIEAEKILFFARDSDIIFDFWQATFHDRPEWLGKEVRFFLNTDLYRDEKGVLEHMRQSGVAPGTKMLWVDTGFGGRNFRDLMSILFRQGLDLQPSVTPVEVAFYVKPYLIASSAQETWFKSFYMLREPGLVWQFVDDVQFPEFPLEAETLSALSGRAESSQQARTEFVLRLEDDAVIPKWEFRPEKWAEGGQPELTAQSAESQKRLKALQRQIAAYVVLQKK